MTSTPIIELKGIRKSFQTQEVLSDLHLQIRHGEFYTLLGPSGCGKTTVLRLIAGFEQPDQGQVLLDGKDITSIPAEHRPINTVFQSYALFPHMTVFENIAFGLKMAGCGQSEIKSRVEEVLGMVRLGDFANRKPDQLSGGQKQRVAIARAVVNRPKVLLLDESLSALDYQLRLQMQNELKQLQRQLGITFIYVTHDQEEALSMSDRVVVMQSGQAQQIGTPRQIYETPHNLFVARFIGEINVFDGQVIGEVTPYLYNVQLDGEYTRQIQSRIRLGVGDRIHVLLRPEDLRTETLKDAGDRVGFVGKVRERNYTGKTLDSVIELPSGKLLKASEFFDEADPDFDYSIAESVWVDWVHGWEHVIPAEEWR